MVYLCPCHFGLEADLKRELAGLNLPVTRVEDGRVFFEGDALAAARANVFLRTADAVRNRRNALWFIQRKGEKK